MKNKKTKAIQQTPAVIQTVGEMTPEALISQAIQKGVNVETLERLLSMRRELKAEYAKAEFDKAMARFQAECPVIVKTKQVKTNSGTDAYKFAPIESIVTQVKPFLEKHGFRYASNMKIIQNGQTQVEVVIKVTHSAGHSEDTTMTVPLGGKTAIMNDSQVVAAAQTFAKRYAFTNAFGILTSDEDNDAILKEKQALSLPKDAIDLINNAESLEQLVGICKTIKPTLKPELQNILVAEYTRRKNKIEKDMADTITEEGESGE